MEKSVAPLTYYVIQYSLNENDSRIRLTEFDTGSFQNFYCRIINAFSNRKRQVLITDILFIYPEHHYQLVSFRSQIVTVSVGQKSEQNF